MSDFKIIGNPDPVVGKEEFYSVNTFFPNVLPFQNPTSNSSFEQPVKWEIYILENGRWRKTKENDKTGKKISYTFLQKSLDRKGIRILARRGEDVARLNVKTHPAEQPKIDRIELLDKNGSKPKKPLSYGQTVKARVHCLHMEKRKVLVTLWEDDVKGAGHAKANEKNIIRTLPGIVKNGKADVDFVLIPSFAKIAKKDGGEDKVHEYYVTTDFNKEKIASNNVDVNDLETPVAPFKRKVPVQQPAQPKVPVKQPVLPKSNKPASSTPPAKEKAEITNVHITDTAGRAITKVYKEKQIKVWIDSKGLIDKDIRLKLFDQDSISNDLLFDEKFTIKSNIYAVVVSLNEILRSKGGDNWFEGAEQEVFAYVEVIGTNKSKPSEIVQVDVKVFKPDPIEITNKVKKVGEKSEDEKKDEEKKAECSCKEYDLVWGSKVSCDFRHKVVEMAKKLGLPQEKYEGANWLMAVMALETINKFSPKIGSFKGSSDENFKYKYVGLIQFGKAAATSVGTTRTHLMSLSAEKQLFYVQKYFEQKQFKNLLKSKVALYLAVNYPEATKKASDNQYVVYDSSTNAYDNNPLFKREKHEFWIDKNGKRCYYEGREGASHVWEFDEAITEVYNQGKKYKEKEFNCDNNNKTTSEKDNKDKIVFFDSGLTEERKKVVSEFTIKLLEKAAENSSNDEVIITSTIRSTRKQAEIMYENENSGNHIRYASAGREIVAVFNKGKKDGEKKENIIIKMDDKIKELAKKDSRVSRHCVPIEVYNKNNIIDISFTRGVKNPRDLIRELVKDSAVTKVIHPLSNVTPNSKISYDSNEPAIHVEIKIS